MLWLGTANGISRFDPERRAFFNFSMRDGLPGNRFPEHAHHQSASGELFFGSENGVVFFFPKDLVDDTVPPDVVLTALQIDDTPVEIGPNSPLEASIMLTESMTLAHDENDLTFEYVGLHFIDPAENQYRYWLEGYDDNWVEAGTQRTARYTNLDPGEYTFRVQAANSHGVWNEQGASVHLTIEPPLWRTTWAYVLYGVLFIVTVVAADRIQRRRLIKRERAALEQAELRERAAKAVAEIASAEAQEAAAQAHALQAENERKEVELEKARQLEQAHNELKEAHEDLKATQDQLVFARKMASLGQMTAGIAHEIKNPLNFVNNFAELSVELADDLEAALFQDQDVSELLTHLKHNATSINHHGKRADAIVQSMMQHASGSPGECRAVALNTLVEKYVTLAYHGRRAQHMDFNVEIERAYDAGAGQVEVVPQEIGRVLLNLLSNAFDAVAEQSNRVNGAYVPVVRVSTHRVGGKVEIRVRDNGPGIAEGLKDRIFEPFYTTKPTGLGNTGLGLSLSYEIVVQGHGGTLSVESEEGQGATFMITLPV